jgi:hypothetical protein
LTDGGLISDQPRFSFGVIVYEKRIFRGREDREHAWDPGRGENPALGGFGGVFAGV